MKTKITLLVLTALLGLTNVFANSMPSSENIVENEIMTTGDNSIIISAGKRIYTLDMNTYQATLLATSPYVNEINSIASDNTTGWIFYVSNHISRYNWTIYGYNVYTNTHKNFGSVRHFFTSTGHANSSRGLASGGATFYNGKLYFAMEYPTSCYYNRGNSSGNQNPKDELPNNVRAAGTVSSTMFINGPISTSRNTSAEADETDNGGRDGAGETATDFEIVDDEAANEEGELLSDYIPEEDLPVDETADDTLLQRGTSNAEYGGSNYQSSTYNNSMYLLEISFSGLSDSSGQTSSVSSGTPVYDNWGYSSFLYKGELGDIVVDDNGQLYAATSYQVQAYNFNSNRYDWANNEDVYAQMAKDKNSALQLLKNKRHCSNNYYYGCRHSSCTTKSFVQSYTAPSNLRRYNNLQIGSLNEISGLNSYDVGKITDASDYIRLTPPVSYKVKGYVFDDNNENGNFNSGQGETKLDGITVTLYADTNTDGVLDAGDTVIESKNTNATGNYTFNNVQVANTLVQVTVPSDDANFTYTLTTAEVVAVTGSTSDITGIKFGINKEEVVVNVAYDVFGTVYDDNNENAVLEAGENGLDNVTLTLYADTNTDGVLDAGDTVITTTTSGTDGSYSFLHVCIQNTIVAVTVPTSTGSFTYTLTTSATQAIDSINTNVTGVDFGINEVQVIDYSISGNVYDDNDESGAQDAGEDDLDGITVTLYADNNANGVKDAGDTVITSASTGVDGTYNFSGVTVQNTVTEVTVPSNNGTFTYTLTTAGQQNTSSTTTDVTEVNFGINQVQVIDYNISGTVFDDNNANGVNDTEAGLDNLTISLYSDTDGNGTLNAGDGLLGTTTTGSNGTYSFSNITTANTLVAVTVPANTANFTYTATTTVILAVSSTINDVNNLDFGINKVQIIDYNISGTVFDDDNANQILEATEGRLDNVTMMLYADNNTDGAFDAGDTMITSTTTTIDGGYAFSSVTTENTLVMVSVPANTANFTYTSTTPELLAATSTTADVTGLNFGINKVQVIDYNISGTVFDDNNANGVNDTEAGLDNLTISLYSDADGDGTLNTGDGLLGTTTTGSNGTYSFSNITTANILVAVTVPVNTADFTYTTTTTVMLAVSSTINDVNNLDFGINKVQIIDYNISGTVFDDDNENGIQDAGEGILDGINITLYADNNEDGNLDVGDTTLSSTSTGVNGAYSFTNITTQYVLAVVTTPGNTATQTYVLTTSNTQAASSTTTDVAGLSFGINEVEVINYNISGTVFDDDNANGTIDAAEAGRLTNVILTLYADNDNNGTLGAADTVITSTTSATDGTYTFSNVTTQNTLVAVTVPANDSTFIYTLTTAAARVTSSLITDVNGADFGINQESAVYAISGNVFNDVNGDGNNASDRGLNNVTVNLYRDTNQNGRIDRGEPLINTTTSDRNGNYQFTGLTDVFVVVQILVPTNTSQYQYTATTPISIALSSGTTAINVNFGIQRTLIVLYNVRGLVWDDLNADQVQDLLELRLQGISITLYEDVNGNGVVDGTDAAISTVTTSLTGTYEFTNVSFTNVIIEPVLPSNGTFTTSGIRTVSSVNTDVNNVDFGIKIIPNLYQVNGVVFDDDNENGIADVGEGSLDGLSVEIYLDTDLSGTYDPNFDTLIALTQTSNGGFDFTNPNYFVDNIPSGQVFVVIVIPAANPPFESYTPTYDPDSGTSNPDGVFPTIMTGNISGVNFGINYVDLNSTSRSANVADTMYTNTSEDVSERLRLYPNPTVRQIAINAEEFAGDVTVEIYNDRGYKVMTTMVSPFGNEIKVDVQRLTPGMYYAKFGSRNKVASKKFIKR